MDKLLADKKNGRYPAFSLWREVWKWGFLKIPSVGMIYFFVQYLSAVPPIITSPLPISTTHTSTQRGPRRSKRRLRVRFTFSKHRH